MPDVSAQGFVSRDPGAYDYAIVGTAAATATVLTSPGFFAGIAFNNRTASGVVTIYDSAGTSLNVIGTITIGTSTNLDQLPTLWYKIRTKNGLTVTTSANQGVTVLYK